MKRRTVSVSLALAALLLGAVSQPAFAGGPLYVNGDGKPFVWDNTKPIQYTVDLGNLGRFTNNLANQWIAAAFQKWASVEGVSFSVQATSPFSSDVTGRNVLQVLNALPANVNLIVLDTDGSAMDALGIDGFSGVTRITGLDARTGKITEALMILSGAESRDLTADRFQGGLIEHEVGHFLGLNHSQLNPHVTLDGDPTNDALATRMSYDDGPNSKPGLHLEDRAWIAALYPKADAPKPTGSIRGRVLFSDGVSGIQGSQVVARKVDDPDATAVASLSGYRYRFGPLGSRDVALQGVFDLPGLPEGEYQLSIEPLSASPFIHPQQLSHPGTFYWRDGAPPATATQDATLIRVTAGSVVEGKDFLLPGPALPTTAIRELEPNDVPELAVSTPLPGLVSGNVSSQDVAFWPLRLDEDREDAIEDWHRIVITAPTLLSARLDAANPAADLNLFLSYTPVDSSAPDYLDASVDAGSVTETVQIELPPATYFWAVSSFDSDTNPATEYRLTVNALPLPEPPTPKPPRIALAAFANLTTNGLRVLWQTDQEANSVVIAGRPSREFGSPALTRDHAIEVPGLPQGAETPLELHTRNAAGDVANLPLSVRTPSPASGRVPLVLGALWQSLAEGDKGQEFTLVARLTNFGNGVAANTQVTGLTLPQGWRFIVPPKLPLELGSFGAGASAPLLVRVERETADAQPLDLKIQGTYATLDGAQRAFGR